MRATDLRRVDEIAALVHPAYPEDAAVFADRLAVFPAGCLMLDGVAGPSGYALAHPWRLGSPPPLNTRLERLPEGADTLHLHDIALLPPARGLGAGNEALRLLLDLAEAAELASASLVAVVGASGFWARAGFAALDGRPGGAALLSYGADARLMVRQLGTGAAGERPPGAGNGSPAGSNRPDA